MPTDPTPIEDPRNAVGLLTDVLDLVLAQPVYQLFETDAIKADVYVAGIPAARDLGRMFTRGPRKVFNGYRRRGTSELYQQLKTVQETPPDADWRIRDNRRRELATASWSMASRILKIAIDVMEDARRWEKYNKAIVEPATPYTPMRAYPAPWAKDWEDHIRYARDYFGVDVGAIAMAECSWRFRDLTERSHRGLNTRAAFEAAWLAGQYDFAKRLITEPFQ
jgi:hypothetical protein